MSLALSITASQLLAAIRSFLLAQLPTGWQVLKAQANRVAMPTGNFAEMTFLGTTTLNTPVRVWQDPGTNPGSDQWTTATQVRVQLDFYGTGASDMSQAIARVLRTRYACDQFAASGVDLTPFYAEEPQNTTMLNAEAQFQERWTMSFIGQTNQTISTPIDFAAQLTTGLVEVDTTYKP